MSQKRRVAHLGKKYKPMSEIGRKNISQVRLGMKFSLETKIKMSNAQKGEKSHLWKGGISKDRNYINERKRKYYYSKPTKKLCNQKWQFMRKGAGKLTIQTIQRVYEDNIKQYGTLTCYLCLKPIEFREDCLEHKIPISRGGTNIKENLAIAHRSCNSKKHIKTEEEYRRIYV